MPDPATRIGNARTAPATTRHAVVIRGSPMNAPSVSNLSHGVRARVERRKGRRVTDTPIYDQMQWEYRAANNATDQPAKATSQGSRRQDGSNRRVSVWALVDEHRRRS